MERRKPVGKTFMLRAEPGKAEVLQNELPAIKEAIEDQMLERCRRAAERAGMNLFGALAPHRNAENHFDYTIETPDGPEYVELMELVPTRYEVAPRVFDLKTRATQIAQMVHAKVLHYGRPTRPLHLLIYSTHDPFHLLPPVSAAVAVAICDQGHEFASVTYFMPLGEDSGSVFRMWPLAPEEYFAYYMTTQTPMLVMPLDVREAVVQPYGASIRVELPEVDLNSGPPDDERE